MHRSECIDSNKVPFTYREIDNLQLLDYAKNKLPLNGFLKYDEIESYCYLKIQDDFIFKLFPLVKENNICMPDYFPPKNLAGAHISIIYPNEPHVDKIRNDIKTGQLNQCFYFEITRLIAVHAFNKTFFALTVLSPQLEQLRTQYDLPTKLNYRGILVPFHITIAMGIRLQTKMQD